MVALFVIVLIIISILSVTKDIIKTLIEGHDY